MTELVPVESARRLLEEELDNLVQGDREQRWERAVALKLADLLPNSRRAYSADLKAFEQFLAVLDVHPVDAQLAHARAFLRLQTEQQAKAPASVARCASALSAIYRDAALTDPGLVTNPFEHVRRPKARRSSPTPSLSVDEARVFVQASRLSPRAHALAMLLLTTGLRISEAIAADFADLQRHADGLTALQITRKGNIQALIALPPAVLDALQANLRTRSSTVTTLARAARGSAGSWPLLQGTNGRMTHSEARREIQRICKAAGWPADRVTAHGLRHTFATTAVDHGHASARRVQQVLGHASIATTETYLAAHPHGDDVTLSVAQLLTS